MARPGEEKIYQAMKEAKDAQEMVDSWVEQRPGYERPGGVSPLDFYIKNKPEMVYTYAHNQLTQVVDRGILDPKTRYLVILGCLMMENHMEGLLPQCCNAKAAGATDQEILEVAFLACYSVSKGKNVDTCLALKNVFDNPTFKNMEKRKDK